MDPARLNAFRIRPLIGKILDLQELACCYSNVKDRMRREYDCSRENRSQENSTEVLTRFLPTQTTQGHTEERQRGVVFSGLKPRMFAGLNAALKGRSSTVAQSSWACPACRTTGLVRGQGFLRKL